MCCDRRPALGCRVDLAPGRGRGASSARVAGIDVRVSELVTDPWTAHVPGTVSL